MYDGDMALRSRPMKRGVAILQRKDSSGVTKNAATKMPKTPKGAVKGA